MYRTSISVAASLLLAGILAGCDRPKQDETGSAAGAAPMDTAADTAAVAGAAADFSDANIVALLDHANKADSSAGALAVEKATNPKVKQFAQMMIADHHQLRKQGADLAKKLGVTPEPPANDPVTPLEQKVTEALTSAPKGTEFDRTYIQQEVTAHQAVLDLADQAHQSADNAELKALIEKARPLIENHLRQAQALEKELGTSA
jgi:putative membrane protein